MIKTVFQTAGIPSNERFGYWHDLVSNDFAPSYMATDHADNFQVRQRMLELGNVQLWKGAFSPFRIWRDEQLIRRSDPEKCCLVLTQRGIMLGDTAGRQVVCDAGDIHCHDTSHPREIAMRRPGGRGHYQGISIMFPRADIPLPGRQIDQVIGARIPRGDGTNRLLTAVIAKLIDDAKSFRPADGPRLGLVLTDLIAALFAGTLDDLHALPVENRKHVLALRVKKFILHNLADPELQPSTIAAAHHISVSYLHRIFRGQGGTVVSWIRRQRLEHARRDLADPVRSAVPIHHIATRWGFKSAADFARAFRGAYGLPPKDYRHDVHSSGTGPLRHGDRPG
jgi:AraC-like DNA-binding protein